MVKSIRFHATALLLSAALLGVVITRPNWPAWWESPAIDWVTDAPPPSEVTADPRREMEAVAKRSKAKHRVIDWVQAGSVTLFEAASWFRLLNDGPREFYAHLWDQLPGETEEENLCHQVIHWVEKKKCGQPSDKEIDQTVARLEMDLLAHLAEHGRVYLPA